MRKLIIATIFVLSFGVSSYSQVTLERTSLMQLVPIRFSSNGIKLRLDSANTIKLYNTDYTLWKTITIPPISGYPVAITNGLISDNLFDTDNDLEIYVTYRRATSMSYRRKILNEDLTELIDLDTSDIYLEPFIYNLDGVHKLFITYGSNRTRIYSLVGSLPCGSCGGVGVPKYNSEFSGEISSPMPNPNNGSATINYSLPNGYNSGVITLFDLSGTIMKMYQVDRNSTELQINTTDLPSGLYYYNLTSNGVELATKKMVKL